MERLKNRPVLLTGATGSIGSATARLLASGGAHLYLTGRNREKLGSLARELQLPDQQWFAGDLTDEQVIQQMAAQFREQGPAPEILINAAGIGIIKPFEQLSSAEFQQSIAINLWAPFLVIKTFLPDLMAQGKGLIINIPGILGKTPMAGATAYCASKYGLNGMMKSLREELKRTEIRITQLFLGGTDSSFWDTIDLRVQRNKMIVAEEAAKAIWFLCQQPTSGVVSEMVIQPFNHQVI
jgi:short-subunit dehydrogenase